MTWTDAAGVLRSPSFPSIVGLGLIMVGLFLAWLGAAYGIYWLTLGPQPPASRRPSPGRYSRHRPAGR